MLGWILDTNAAFLPISLAPIALRLDSKVSKSVSSRRGITVHYVGHVLDFKFNIKTLKWFKPSYVTTGTPQKRLQYTFCFPCTKWLFIDQAFLLKKRNMEQISRYGHNKNAWWLWKPGSMIFNTCALWMLKNWFCNLRQRLIEFWAFSWKYHFNEHESSIIKCLTLFVCLQQKQRVMMEYLSLPHSYCNLFCMQNIIAWKIAAWALEMSLMSPVFSQDVWQFRKYCCQSKS